MENSINATKELIAYQISCGKTLRSPSFDNYQKMYAFTNENIKSYMNILTSNNTQNVLSVLSSGDHAFNLISHGILGIDTFDTNRLTEYYALGLKRALILKYNYEEFKQIYEILSSSFTSVEEITEIIYGLFPFMESKHYKYWKEIIDYNYEAQKFNKQSLNLLDMLTLGVFLTEAEYYNSYLTSEERYNELRRNLSFANITYKYCNARYLTHSFSKKYDAILLSNILDYFCAYWGMRWKYECLEKYGKELEVLIRKNGLILLDYLFFYGCEPNFRRFVINSSSVTLDELCDEEISLLDERKDLRVKDALMLRRVK